MLATRESRRSCSARVSYTSRDAYDQALADALHARNVGLVCLAGFMRLVGAPLLRAFPDSVLNIHPSLLPAFPGLEAQRQAVEHGVRVSGATVHLVTAELDGGPIILQSSVPVLDDDTPDTLAARILIRNTGSIRKRFEWSSKESGNSPGVGSFSIRASRRRLELGEQLPHTRDYPVSDARGIEVVAGEVGAKKSILDDDAAQNQHPVETRRDQRPPRSHRQNCHRGDDEHPQIPRVPYHGVPGPDRPGDDLARPGSGSPARRSDWPSSHRRPARSPRRNRQYPGCVTRLELPHSNASRPPSSSASSTLASADNRIHLSATASAPLDGGLKRSRARSSSSTKAFAYKKTAENPMAKPHR